MGAARRAPGECFVYITLPGQTEQVTAGRFTLALDRRGIPEGRFVYGRSYLERPNAVALDPVELKLSPRTYATAALGGVFGALRDASPDFWGRRVIQRYLGKAQPGEMEYLLHSPDDRAGALGFGLNQTPPAPRRAFNQTLDLAKVQSIADALVADDDCWEGVGAAIGAVDHEQVENLLLIGTSMGGARPKAVVEDAAGLWIAKFNRPDDNWNSARVENAMLILARTMQHGVRGGLAAAFGVSAGCVLHALAAVFGLAALLATSAAAFATLKWAGAAYLLWLAFGMLRTALKPTAAPAQAAPPVGDTTAAAGVTMASVAPAPGAPGPWRLFRQGLYTNALNPKVALFFLALLPQFIDGAAPHKTLAFLLLGAWFVTQGTLFLIAFVLLAAPLARWHPTPAIERTLHALGGGLFVALAAKLALAQRH